MLLQILFYFLLVVHVQGNDSSEEDLINDTRFTGKHGKKRIKSFKSKRLFESASAIPSYAVPGAQCVRDCTNATPKVCYYDWHVERYSTLGPACGNCSRGVRGDCWAPQCVIANGFQRGILTVNRQGPGPGIYVCRGDRIIVRVANEMPDEATTIHWHGFQQKKSPWMDGAFTVTQCAIPPLTEFTYNFLAEEAGTFFWHSHVGAQKLEIGMEGPLIVGDGKNNTVNGKYYDVDQPEYVIFIQDWTNLTSNQYIPGIHNQRVDQVPDSVLINGKGRYSVFNTTNNYIPLTSFTVESGKRYRFRLIGASCMTCSYAVKIVNHNLTVITVDGGNEVRPVVVTSVVLNSAERADVVVHANQRPGTYFIYVQSVEANCRGIRQVALLHYKGSGNLDPFAPVNPPPTGPLGLTYNNPNSVCDGSNSNEICSDMLAGVGNAPSIRGFNGPYVQSVVLLRNYDFKKDELFAPGTYQRFEEPAFNILLAYLAQNISFKFPSSPLLTQYYDNPEDTFCSPDCYENTESSPPCQCTNVVNVPSYAILDIILIDSESREESFNHPMHIHGHNWWPLELGVLDQNLTLIQRIDFLRKTAARDDYNLRNRAMKDTVSVPRGGHAVVRVYTANPGYWLLHCHFVFHLENGMALVYKVGEDREMLKPSGNFPRCGNYYGN